MTRDSENGYILSSVLLTGFLIISLLFSVLVIVFFNHKLDTKRLIKKRLELACYSAVQMHIASRGKEITDGRYQRMVDSCLVTVSSEMKGVFAIVSSEARQFHDSARVSFLRNRAISPDFINAQLFQTA